MIVKEKEIDFREIGRVVADCHNFEDVWIGPNQDLDKIDVVCAVNSVFNTIPVSGIHSKVVVNLSRLFGTQFVKDVFNVEIIQYLSNDDLRGDYYEDNLC